MIFECWILVPMVDAVDVDGHVEGIFDGDGRDD